MDQNNQTPQAALEEDFFLPNFCAVKTIFILCIGAELVALVLILATGDILRDSWDELGLLSVFVQWIAFASAGVLCTARRFLAKLSLVWAAISAYLLVVLVTGCIAGMGQYLLLKINYQWGSNPETISQFVSRCVMISAIMTFVALRYFYIQHQWKRRIELESQARVEALQARIRPHFLFNSMNIIASLIHSQPKAAEQAVEDLSELFRATLHTGAMIPLSQEWDLCRNYLRIEGLRLDNRLTIDADLSKVPEDAAIPMLTLQPLVENAIYHGIQPRVDGGVIDIALSDADQYLSIRISNPFDVNTPASRSGNGMALNNLEQRLLSRYGKAATFSVAQDQDTFVVSFSLPCENVSGANVSPQG